MGRTGKTNQRLPQHLTLNTQVHSAAPQSLKRLNQKKKKKRCIFYLVCMRIYHLYMQLWVHLFLGICFFPLHTALHCTVTPVSKLYSNVLTRCHVYAECFKIIFPFSYGDRKKLCVLLRIEIYLDACTVYKATDQAKSSNPRKAKKVFLVVITVTACDVATVTQSGHLLFNEYNVNCEGHSSGNSLIIWGRVYYTRFKVY